MTDNNHEISTFLGEWHVVFLTDDAIVVETDPSLVPHEGETGWITFMSV